jgi:hypothetical protein
MAQDYFVVWVPKRRSYISYKGGYTPLIDDAKLYTSAHMAMCDGKDYTGAPCHGEEFLIDRVGFRLLNPL